MTDSYNHGVTASANLRLDNLLAALSLNLTEDGQRALESTSALTGRATTALLALDEFLGGAHVGQLAEVLGLTHSGAVRLVTQLERDHLAERRQGVDRRRVEVRLTPAGQRRAREARGAREAVFASASSGLTFDECRILEALLDKLVSTQVARRIERRRTEILGAWWCRACTFAACGRPEGRCPAQAAAAQPVIE
jgi:MarR family transcriptional repressor of emrRAB